MQRHKAIWIYRWSRTPGMTVSRDEIAEMVLQDSRTPDLERLWEQGRAKQKLVIQLCDTTVDGSLDDLKVLCSLSSQPATACKSETTLPSSTALPVMAERGLPENESPHLSSSGAHQ